MKVLIPLLSKNEKNEEFLDKAVRGAHEVVLLIVIDADEKSKLRASDISSSTHFLEEVKKLVGKRRKKCEDLTEWGETAKKIKNTAILNKVDRISILKQENQWFEEIIKELKEEKEIKNRIQIIEIDFEKPEVEDVNDFEQEEQPFLEKQTFEKSLNKTTLSKRVEPNKVFGNLPFSEKGGKAEVEQKNREEKNVMQETKEIADKILKKGFKSLDSIKKIRFKKEED